MSVKDVIKSKVYESFGGGSALSVQQIILLIVIAMLLGIYIFMVYKLTCKCAFYSKDLNMTMAGLPVIVAAIMIAMQANLLVSLGMVGALSIVRFRNAIKNPLDLLYLFWAISGGIIVGVGLYTLAIVLCVVMTALLLVLGQIPNAKAPDLLVLRGKSGAVNYDRIYKILSENGVKYKEKARTIKNEEVEMIVEIRAKKKEKMIEELGEQECLTQIHCIAHDGESRI